MYQPWHKSRSLPPYCQYLATSNILPNNKVSANYNGHCSEKDLFASSDLQIRQINNAVHPLTSSSEWRQERLGGRKSPSPWCNAQLEIQKEACGRETTRNALLKQWRECEIDWGLCWERNCCSKKASWRCRGSGPARAERYEACWNHGIDNQRAWKDFWGDDGCYRRQYDWSNKSRRWGGWGW